MTAPNAHHTPLTLSTCVTRIVSVEAKVKKLLGKLVQLQTSLLVQNPDTRGMVSNVSSTTTTTAATQGYVEFKLSL